MTSTGITREEADRLKKNVISRDGGYTNANAVLPMPRAEANKIREEAGLKRTNPCQGCSPHDKDNDCGLCESLKEDTPIHVVSVPQAVPQDYQQIQFSPEQVALIKAKFAPNSTQTEFELFLYMAKKYNLDPLLKQIWLVKFGDSPAQIYAGRDGYLEIAHRSGHFDGMKSWVEYEEDSGGKKTPIRGKCVVYRNDMQHPFESEVLFKEYTTGKNLWLSKPSIMLIKVAESVCLRKAFRVSGLYDPDEMG
jgi:phage recombination protein Bet